MSNPPLLSIIIPTRNSEKTIEACLESIKMQTYKNIEIIVVDNNSSDNTKQFAQKYTDLVYNKGQERSTQRNYGAKKSTGKYLLFIDSDMELSKKVVEECMEIVRNSKNTKAIIIPEESFGIGFWAQCKKLERSFYIGVDWIEAARFYQKNLFLKIGGFNKKLISAEDWDLSQKVMAVGEIDRINSFIFHNEGSLSFIQTLKKKFYYAKSIKDYQQAQQNLPFFLKQTGIVSRYKLFFSSPKKLFHNPIVTIGMFFMKTAEFAVGGVGYLISIFSK